MRDAAKEFTRQARALIFADRFSHFEQQQAGGEARGLGASEREAGGGRVRTGGGLSELAAGFGWLWALGSYS